MRINIDISNESVSKLSVLAANAERDRKNYIQDILEAHAIVEYARFLRGEIKKIKPKTH